MAKTTPTPSLEESPQFKQRMTSALGGAPTSPTQFQPINGPTAATPQTGSKPAAVQPTKSQAKTIFDEDQNELAMRAKLEQARSRLNGLINAVASKTEGLDEQLSAIDGDEVFKAYAKSQGFDASKASSFLDAIIKAADKVRVKA